MARLETRLEGLTGGDNDITLASQLRQKYQASYDDGVGYSILKPDGTAIVEDMAEKITKIFEYNIQALEVSL